MAKNMEGKTALVTGGGSGIGRASALALARAGARIAVADVNIASATETASLIENEGFHAIPIAADVSKSSDVEAMVARTVDAYGRLDCAVNNAGIEGDVGVPIADYAEDNWDQVIDINLKGVWLCLKYQLAHMTRQGSGAIVNMASVAGLVGGTFGAAYHASKHGVVGLTKAAAIECADSGIRVNAVCPGVIRTEMADRLINDDQEIESAIAARHPVGRMGTPDEVAKTVVWLSSDAASFVTGQALAVDGGFVSQ